MVVLDVDTGRKTELSGGAVDLSANGRFVVYLTGLSSGANALHIYDHRTKTSSPVTVLVNGENVAVIVVGQDSNSMQKVSISGDGRYIAFVTRQALVPGDNNGRIDAYVYDREEHRVALASARKNGTAAPGLNEVWNPEISADGHYIAFKSYYDFIDETQDGGNWGFITTNPLYEAGYCAGYSEFGAQ